MRMMSVLSTRANTDWRFWSGGLLVSSFACFSCPVGGTEYGLTAALIFLFYWGLLRSESELGGIEDTGLLGG